jgi:drug/metabolite transporter (DMT)-like permease
LGNYVIFTAKPKALPYYGLYYYGFLIAGTFLNLKWAKQISQPASKTALRWLAIGCLSFLLPTTTVNILLPETTAGIPSIMCGFAVIFAVILLVKILPNAGVERVGTAKDGEGWSLHFPTKL